MTEHNELLMFAKDAADFFERRVTHSSSPSGFPRSSKISSTRAPRLMDSSRWKMRCGVYFKRRAGTVPPATPVDTLPAYRLRCRHGDPKSAHENMRALKIGGDIDSINAHQCPFEINFARNDAA